MKKIVEIRRGERVPEGSRWLKDIERSVGTKTWIEEYTYGVSTHCSGPDYQPFDVFEVEDSNSINHLSVTLDSDIEEFYTQLKSAIKGRVVNGTMNGCILESELEEIYENLKK